MRARDAAGNLSALSTALAVTTPAAGDGVAPSIPQNLHTTSVTSTSVALAWNASTDNVGVTAYIVARNGVDLPATAGTTLTDGLLAPGVTYTYTVRARDAALNTSAPSTSVVVTTPDGAAPSVPTGLATTAVSASSVSLTWNASTDNVAVTGYEVRRNGTLIGSPGGTTFTDSTVVANQTYSYTVSARDAAGQRLGSEHGTVRSRQRMPTPRCSPMRSPAPRVRPGVRAGPPASTSGTATQQSGTGQLALTDTAGAFSRALLSGLAERTNSDTTFSYQFNSTTAVAYFSVFARGSGGWQNSYRPRNGYGLEMRPQSGTVEVLRNNNGTTSTLATVSGARQVNTAKQWIRLRVSGSTIQFKSWADGSAEPAAWTSTVTDSTVTAAGQLHFSIVRGGSNTGLKDVRIDDVSVVDAP